MIFLLVPIRVASYPIFLFHLERKQLTFVGMQSQSTSSTKQSNVGSKFWHSDGGFEPCRCKGKTFFFSNKTDVLSSLKDITIEMFGQILLRKFMLRPNRNVKNENASSD